MAIRFFAGCQVAYINSMLNLSMVLKIKKMFQTCFVLFVGVIEVLSCAVRQLSCWIANLGSERPIAKQRRVCVCVSCVGKANEVM